MGFLPRLIQIVEFFTPFAQFFGCLILFYSVGTFQRLTLGDQERLEHVVRYLAYEADYQTMNDYPRIDKDERYVLHKNGVISRATIQPEEVIETLRIDWYIIDWNIIDWNIFELKAIDIDLFEWGELEK